MITSNYIINLSERYINGKKTFMGYAKVFENPTSSDLLEIEKYFQASQPDNIRYLAKAKANAQTVYVWDANLALHKDIRQLLGFPYEPEKSPDIINGEATLSNGKVKFLNADSVDYRLSNFEIKNVPDAKLKEIRRYLSKVFGYDWNWLDYYIKGFGSHISQQKEKFMRLAKIDNI